MSKEIHDESGDQESIVPLTEGEIKEKDSVYSYDDDKSVNV